MICTQMFDFLHYNVFFAIWEQRKSDVARYMFLNYQCFLLDELVFNRNLFHKSEINCICHHIEYLYQVLCSRFNAERVLLSNNLLRPCKENHFTTPENALSSKTVIVEHLCGVSYNIHHLCCVVQTYNIHHLLNISIEAQSAASPAPAVTHQGGAELTARGNSDQLFSTKLSLTNLLFSFDQPAQGFSLSVTTWNPLACW